jgi:hypothetical protein
MSLSPCWTPRPERRAGYVISIAQSFCLGKCRLALESIAARYACSSVKSQSVEN